VVSAGGFPQDFSGKKSLKSRADRELGIEIEMLFAGTARTVVVHVRKREFNLKNYDYDTL
jgi:hypothetical protein